MARHGTLTLAAFGVVLVLALFWQKISEASRGDPYGSYIKCLMSSYTAEDDGRTHQVILKAYYACDGKGNAYRQDLADRGLAKFQVVRLVEQLNEVTYARYLGVDPIDTRGCFRQVSSRPIS